MIDEFNYETQFSQGATVKITKGFYTGKIGTIQKVQPPHLKAQGLWSQESYPTVDVNTTFAYDVLVKEKFLFFFTKKTVIAVYEPHLQLACCQASTSIGEILNTEHLP